MVRDHAALARDQIQIAGSSTVLPYAAIVAEAKLESGQLPAVRLCAMPQSWLREPLTWHAMRFSLALFLSGERRSGGNKPGRASVECELGACEQRCGAAQRCAGDAQAVDQL